MYHLVILSAFFGKKMCIYAASLCWWFAAASYFPSPSSPFCFPLSPSACLHLGFSDKALFILALSGAHLLTLLSITQPAVRRHWWLWAAPLCFWSLMWPAADVHLPQGEESMYTASVYPQQRSEGGRCSSLCRLYQNAQLSTMRSHCLPSMKWSTMAGNVCNLEPHCWEMRCLQWVTWCEQRHFIQCALGWHSGLCDGIQLPFTGETWQMIKCDMGRFVDSWHTNSEETDDTEWSTVHLLLYKPLALTGCTMWNVYYWENHFSRYSQFNACAHS